VLAISAVRFGIEFFRRNLRSTSCTGVVRFVLTISAATLVDDVRFFAALRTRYIGVSPPSFAAMYAELPKAEANIHAGILLLYKEALRRESPADTNDVLM
jgi:hypothetical protein